MVDITIVGAGIVGLATALRFLERFPRLRVAVYEKEREVAVHQTGHNSGVIHSGVYYHPASLKARLCREGSRRMLDFCQRHGIRTVLCSKLIIAAGEEELPRLEELHRRGLANGVPGLRRLNGARIGEIEPRASGVAALHVPDVAIVDFRRVARAMASEIGLRGGEVVLGARVLGIREGGGAIRLETSEGDVETRHLVNCAGLFSDRVARLAGLEPGIRIVPFRGEYYALVPEVRHWVRGLIYPVPDPRFPFLGVHLTPLIDGGVEAGPNAVLALAREGYGWSRVALGDVWELLSFPGFRRLARRFWREGFFETRRSFSKSLLARSLQRLLPDLDARHLMRGGAGVRAQAVGRDGGLVADFLFLDTPRSLHVLNAPSPAATASLAIADRLVTLAARRWGLESKTPACL